MRSMTWRLVLCTAGLLNGCATVSVHQDMTAGLQRLVGQDIQDAIERLGYPEGQRTVAGDLVYTWHLKSWEGAMYIPRAAALVEGESEPAPLPTTPQVHGPAPFRGSCDIEIATGRGGRIKGYQWEGNRGCRFFAARLLQSP